MIADSDIVIYGEITDYQIKVEEGSGTIYTLETIRVLEPLYGDIQTDSVITLLETGGCALIRDYIDSFVTEEERLAKRTGRLLGGLSDEEIETKYITQIPEGYYYPETGARSVLFLKANDFMDGTYMITGCWQGKYRESENGVMIRPNTSSCLSGSEETGSLQTVSFEDLKVLIKEAV